MAHPAYDAYWQEPSRSTDCLPPGRRRFRRCGTQGLWDQEDIWGANRAWRALKAAGHEANNWLVLGPWNHNQVQGRRQLAGADVLGRRHRAPVSTRHT